MLRHNFDAHRFQEFRRQNSPRTDDDRIVFQSDGSVWRLDIDAVFPDPDQAKSGF